MIWAGFLYITKDLNKGMPELPNVEIFKRYIDATSLHKTVRQVDVLDSTVLGMKPDQLISSVTGHNFKHTERFGKYLLITLETEGLLVMHFGMTGNLKYHEKDLDAPYSQIVFHFKGGSKLHYICKRKLGRIELAESSEAFLEKHHIGKDALSLSQNEFLNLLKDKRGGIKSALMNQKLIAGIGNVYSDEILYQCKIHPKTEVKSLSKGKLEMIYHAMTDVLTTAIGKDADPDEMPHDFLITHRSESEDCPVCGGRIRRIEISGRGSYICPNCQKL